MQRSANVSNVHRGLNQDTAAVIHVFLSVFRTAMVEKLNPEDKTMVTFAPSDFPCNAVDSGVRQSGSLSPPHTQRGTITFITTNSDKKGRQNESAKTNIRTLLPTERPF